MSDILVFNRKTVRQNRNRAFKNFENHNFLFEWCEKEITDRLSQIKREFPLSLSIGARGNNIKTTYTLDIAENFSPDVQADEEFLPFTNNSFDLIVSNLGLHSTNDLPGTLIQIRNALKPDGLFIGTLFGGETLYELREVLQEVEMTNTGGARPHVSPVADLKQMGALMQRGNYALPVIDSEKITVTYDNLFALMTDLKNMGESNTLLSQHKGMTSKNFFETADKTYKKRFAESDGKIIATFEIIFLLGWAPHSSQQKPLQPGSAKTRLADALETKEKALPC